MAKTIRNQYDKFLTYENLMKAHLQSRKSKGYRKDIILFNLKQEEYIKYLYEKLKNQKYKHGEYKTFYIYEPKKRKIEASRYIDRIVHRWYVNSFMEEYFIKQFIRTSYACIKNRGMHLAAIELKNGMRKCKTKWNEYYILKMDVAKYFQNINKDKLYNILKRKIKDEKLLWLTKEIIYSTEGEKGIPIGNYTSQVFANIYLNEIDQYIKHKLKVKYYYRYMDDSVLLVQTKIEAKELLKKIGKFLKEELDLELNNKTQVFKNKQGVNFCGYKINEYRMKIRDKGKRKLKKKIKKLKYEIRKGKISSKGAKKYLVGHIGYIKYANTYCLINKLFAED